MYWFVYLLSLLHYTFHRQTGVPKRNSADKELLQCRKCLTTILLGGYVDGSGVLCAVLSQNQIL